MIAYVYNDANPGTLGVIIKGQTLKKESFDTTTYRKEKCKTNNNFRGVRLKSGRSPADIRIQNNRRQQSSKHQLYVMDVEGGYAQFIYGFSRGNQYSRIHTKWISRNLDKSAFSFFCELRRNWFNRRYT